MRAQIRLGTIFAAEGTLADRCRPLLLAELNARHLPFVFLALDMGTLTVESHSASTLAGPALFLMSFSIKPNTHLSNSRN